ncbi:MAG: type II secretion system protein [Planctomycetota bacterium]|jgi:prepilin-type N-terminal cleavage/methylation domain-containing protein
MTSTNRHSVRARAGRGFTLVEMLIVIGIIVLLLGLTVTVSTGLLRGSEVRGMENAFRIIDAAIQEWELAADGQMRAGFTNDCEFPPEPLDICYEEVPPTTSDPSTIDVGIEAGHELLKLLNRNQSAREIIAGIDAKLLRRLEEASDPEHPLDFLDPWDQQVIVVFPWIRFDPNNPPVYDEDQSPRNVFEDRFGAATSQRPYLVSAGPDGQFGNLHLDTAESSLSDSDRADIELAADNVYSSPVQQTRP